MQTYTNRPTEICVMVVVRYIFAVWGSTIGTTASMTFVHEMDVPCYLCS